MIIKRGDIFVADLDPVIGSEQGGERPVLIIQNDIGNRYSPTVVVAAITSRINKKTALPTHTMLTDNTLPEESMVLLEQIRTIDKRRLKSKIGMVLEDDMKSIEQALQVSLALSS